MHFMCTATVHRRSTEIQCSIFPNWLPVKTHLRRALIGRSNPGKRTETPISSRSGELHRHQATFKPSEQWAAAHDRTFRVTSSSIEIRWSTTNRNQQRTGQPLNPSSFLMSGVVFFSSDGRPAPSPARLRSEQGSRSLGGSCKAMDPDEPIQQSMGGSSFKAGQIVHGQQI
ncbi:hypothetical protein ACLOJK_040513 [Asimina triloba]